MDQGNVFIPGGYLESTPQHFFLGGVLEEATLVLFFLQKKITVHHDVMTAPSLDEFYRSMGVWNY